VSLPVPRRGLLRRLPVFSRSYGQVDAYARAWDQANETALLADGPLWLVLGDSAAQGVGASAHDLGWVGQVRRRLVAADPRPWRVLNLSRSGARAADVVDRQLPALEALSPAPDLVTCAIGANDIVRRTPEPVLEERLRTIMGRLPPGAVIATLPQGLNAVRTEAANRVIRDGAPAAGLVVADVWARTGPPWHGKLAADGFHPGARGYADWAGAFAEVLDLALATSPPEPEGPPRPSGVHD
jgi:lysophospholipase L1-like esterase